MLYTPLEQFQIILLFSIKLFCFDFSITNLVLVNFLVLLLLLPILFSCEQSKITLKSKVTVEADSITLWIAESKQSKLDLVNKKWVLQKAYIAAQNIASDSIALCESP